MSTDMFPYSFIKYVLDQEVEKVVSENCKVCGNEITVMAHKGSGWCSQDCKKKSGADVSSVGTMMFVTSDEASLVKMSRNPGLELRVE